MPLNIMIAPGSNDPIYKQIVDQVCLAITNETLQSGEKLPSVRALAHQLLVNVNTVVKAYNELVKLGVIESKQGRGVFVSERRQIYSDAERKKRLDQASTTFINEILVLDFDEDTIVEIITQKLQELKPKAKS